MTVYGDATKSVWNKGFPLGSVHLFIQLRHHSYIYMFIERRQLIGIASNELSNEVMN